MKNFKKYVAVLAVALFGGVFALAPAAPAYALDPLDTVCTGDDAPTDSAICGNRNEDGKAIIGTVVNTLLFVVGALSVVMIIVSGVLYVTSTGDSGRVSRAKNTLTYSIVGLVIAFLAYAIINWVVDLF